MAMSHPHCGHAQVAACPARSTNETDEYTSGTSRSNEQPHQRCYFARFKETRPLTATSETPGDTAQRQRRRPWHDP